MKTDGRETYDYRYDNNSGVLVCAWKDNQIVVLFTTFDTVEGTTCLRWSKEKKEKISTAQPQMYANYNKGMGGVDFLDEKVNV